MWIYFIIYYFLIGVSYLCSRQYSSAFLTASTSSSSASAVSYGFAGVMDNRLELNCRTDVVTIRRNIF